MNEPRPPRAPVAYLGAGLMAAPMIERLLDAGHPVAVWNRTRAKLAPLLARGAQPLERPADAAAVGEIVLMCLMDADAVEATVFGVQGLAGAPAGTRRARVLVDPSSIRPDATRAFADRLQRDAGIAWVDAPVSGGIAGARAGTLAIMCGGEPGAVAAAEPVLRAYAAAVTRMGPSGAGQTTKLINQVIAGSAMATIAEAVALAQAAGLDAGALTRALAGGWADSKPLQVFVPRMVDGYDTPIGAIATMLKDLDTAADLARACRTPLPMASQAQQLFRTLVARGDGEDDPAALVRLYRPPAGGAR
jgi:3-hydroxyisobutyrate dehydrogenase-like beta-hydroxyacid dehydrogenase